jgi:ribosomal protein S18 acetylase RimI-like enzyme
MVPKGSPEICFRQARIDDVGDLVLLEAATFDLHRIDRRHFVRLLQSGSVFCLVATRSMPGERSTMLGYGLVFLRRGKTRARLYSLAVDSSLRGQGLGTELVQRLMVELAELGQSRLSLEVRAEDTAVVRFYERLGFCLLERLPEYYDDRAEALRLVQCLPVRAEVAQALAG